MIAPLSAPSVRMQQLRLLDGEFKSPAVIFLMRYHYLVGSVSDFSTVS